MKLLVCIPTIEGREHFLNNAMEGYRTRTPPEVELEVEVVHDAPTCGVGWQQAIDRALDRGAEPDYIHFGNDDIVVGQGWMYPLVEAVDMGFLPASRLEPAGVHLDENPALSMAPFYVPPSKHSYFYADLPENQPQRDWSRIDHSALPFCSLHQWRLIGPFIPIHFGTDKWFYFQAQRRGIEVAARMESVIFNYAAQVGREKGEWTETDLIDFDLNIAYPEYVAGRLQPDEEHQNRLTLAGLIMAREWRHRNLPPPYHWEE